MKSIVLFFVLLALSCSENKEVFYNLKKAEIPISSASYINSVHTDSGKVSSVLNSPKMLNFSNAVFPYYEFPNQLEVILYDKNNNKTKELKKNFASVFKSLFFTLLWLIFIFKFII